MRPRSDSRDTSSQRTLIGFGESPRLCKSAWWAPTPVPSRKLSCEHRARRSMKCGGYVLMPLSPFGGIKESGYGKEGGHEGTEEYMVTKLIALGVSLHNMPKTGV